MTTHRWTRAAAAAVELGELGDQLATALDGVLAVAGIEERYRNRPGDTVVVLSADPWKWVFEPSHLPARKRTRDLLDRWLELARHTLDAVAPETVADFDREEPALRAPLDLSAGADGPGAPDSAAAAAYVREALETQRALLLRALGSNDDSNTRELWLVPDTNALLKNPALEEWADDATATIVLVPQVLRELDHHKQQHRVEGVRRKAQKLLRQFEEYARRGDTFEGVTLAGSLKFREIAVDADVRESLSWLRTGHPDDQLLASVLDLRWHNPAVAITLVTEDRALRNKARQAGVATDRAPTPGASEKPGVSETTAIGVGPRIRVKAVCTVDDQLPAPPLFQTLEPVSVLVVTIVNAGDRAGFDIHGPVYFHQSVGGTRQMIDVLDLPVLEVDGTYECRFPSRSPAWPRGVGPRNVTIDGTCCDAKGAWYSIG